MKTRNSFSKYSLLTLLALLLGGGVASASLVLQLNPGDYQTSTNAWPIAAGSRAGD